MTDQVVEMQGETVKAIDLATDERVMRERLLAFSRLVIALVAQVATVFSWTVDAGGLTAIAMTAVDLYILIRHVWWTDNNVTKEAVAINAVKKLTKLANRNTKIVPKHAKEGEDAR